MHACTLPLPPHTPPNPHPPTPSQPQVVKSLCEMINKKDKKANVKPFMAKNYLWVFVNCLIENPAFDSQARARRAGAPGPAVGRRLQAAGRRGRAARALGQGCPPCAVPIQLPTCCPSNLPPRRLQTKDTLTLRASSFGSKCDLPDPFLKKVGGCA